MVAQAADNPTLYEDLSLVIQEYEKQALRKASRESTLSVVQSTMWSMDHVLETSETLLRDHHEPTVGIPEVGEAEGVQQEDNPLINLEFDADLAEILGGDDEALANYLEECLDCNARLRFSWQVQPINLIAELEPMLQDITNTLDFFERRIDPFTALQGICQVLNGVNFICIPDLVTILMSLKMLIRRYSVNTIEIKLDWTILFGPILRAIVQGVADLANNINSVLMAPLNCSIGALEGLNDLEREGRDIVRQARNVQDQIQQVLSGTDTEFNAQFLARDVTWGDSTIGEASYPEAPELGSLEVHTENISTFDEAFRSNTGGFRIPTGFSLDASTTLRDALADPDFVNATWIQRFLVAVRDARDYVNDLVSNINQSLNSLNRLVGRGLNVDLQNAGILLFLIDMVALVRLIITMLSRNRDVTDWCAYLSENPQVFARAIEPVYGSISVASEDSLLILRDGPNILGKIPTCINSRTTQYNQALSQWINDLNAGTPSG